jgi:hypothetical protein
MYGINSSLLTDSPLLRKSFATQRAERVRLLSEADSCYQGTWPGATSEWLER